MWFVPQIIGLIQRAILWMIWFVGLAFSLVPFLFMFNVDRAQLDQMTFGQSVSVTLLLTACFGISVGLLLFYEWLSKRWNQKS